MLGNVMILVGLPLLRALRVSTVGQQQLLSSRSPAASIGRKSPLDYAKITMCNLVKPLLLKGFTEPPSSLLREN